MPREPFKRFDKQVPLTTVITLYAFSLWHREAERLAGMDVADDIIHEAVRRNREAGPAPAEPGFLAKLVELLNAATVEVAPQVAIEVREAVLACVKGED